MEATVINIYLLYQKVVFFRGAKRSPEKLLCIFSGVYGMVFFLKKGRFMMFMHCKLQDSFGREAKRAMQFVFE